LESELFGYEVGAFTGATRKHLGCFERADGGTLVLDEIACASLAVQEKLLRVIEYGELQRVGGSETRSVDVSIVGASNVDLPHSVELGQFRADLLNRLSFDVVTLPPLRARPTDILTLGKGFALEMMRTLRRDDFPGFSTQAQVRLLAYHWPGNVRELKNVVERAVYQSNPDEQAIEVSVFDPFASPWRIAPPQVSADTDPSGALARRPAPKFTRADSDADITLLDFKGRVDEFESSVLRQALEAAQYNKRECARALGLG